MQKKKSKNENNDTCKNKRNFKLGQFKKDRTEKRLLLKLRM